MTRIAAAPAEALGGRRTRHIVAAAALALAGAAALSIVVGSNPLTPAEIWHALSAYQGTETDRVVVDLRVPRTAATLLAGIAIGMSGALIQALTRNPLGDPGILGVNAGAALAVAVAVALGAVSPERYLPFAFVGALVVTAVVTAIGSIGRGGPDPVRLTLAGAAVSAVLLGVTTGMTLLDPVAFAQLRSWTAGSLVDRGWEVVLPAVPFVTVGVGIALLVAGPLNMMGLGDDLARSLGTRPGVTRALTVLAVTLLAGAATAVAGPIGFLGLAVPHVARWLVGPDQKRILAVCMLLSPAFLLIADVIGRILLWPAEVPVGIVTAFLGAPVLIALVRRSRAIAL